MKLWPFIVLIFMPEISGNQRIKRQLSLDDIISRALSLVRPIFDTSQPLQNDDMLRKRVSPNSEDMKESSILGSTFHSALRDLPLCKGDSRICKFITCSAENFKKDPTFSNLQLAAQVLGDSKLRHAIGSNPEAIDAVCTEQGMSNDQCKVFSKGFQIIDRVITTIEEPKEGRKVPQSDPIPIPIQKDNQIPLNDDIDYDIPTANPKAMGSKTWSSQQNPREPVLLEDRNDLVASLTPPPGIPFLPMAPPLFTFAPPTPPTAPPLAFPTVPSIVFPSLKLPTLGDLPFDKSIFHLKTDPPIRRKKSIEEEILLRDKRDYYDDLNSKPQSSGQAPSEAEDYYGELEQGGEKSTLPPSPLRNCVNMLG